MAVDPLARDEVDQEFEAGHALAQDVVGFPGAVFGAETGQAELVQAGADQAAIARGTAESGDLGIEDGDRAARPGERQGRGQAGVSATDNGHVDALGQRGAGLGERGQIDPVHVPPIGRELAVGSQRVRSHQIPFSIRGGA